MAILVRKIRKAKWQSKDLPWLSDGEIQADALGDLQSKANTLSVYEVEDEENAIHRALAALVASGDVISNLDYVALDLERVQSLSIKISSTLGDTADEDVNIQHRDLSELTIDKLVALADLIQSAPRHRTLEPTVTRWIADGLQSKRLNREKVRLKAEQLAKADRLLQVQS